MGKKSSEVSEHGIFFIEKQEVVVNDFAASGFILDIGGGGEGIFQDSDDRG